MMEREKLIPENFDEVVQRCLVQGVVVKVCDQQAHYVITHVLDGRGDILDDDFYPDYRTASTASPWFSEVRDSYRALWDEFHERDYPTFPEETDIVELGHDTDVVPGDTIHIHETLFWEPNDKGGKNGYTRYDVCKLPVPNIGLDNLLENIIAERARRVEETLAEAVELEQKELLELERLAPGKFIRPFKEPGRHDPTDRRNQTAKATLTYGDGPVKDHFLEVKVRSAYEGDIEIGGPRRFGYDGTQYVVPAIMPFGKGTEEDPLYELEIHISSETKINPAVGEVRPVIVIDGVKYEALIDVEQSSSGFKTPGHDVVFSGFRREETQFDMAQLTEEQIEVLDARFKREGEITRRKLYQSLARGEDFVANWDTINDEADEEVKKQNDLHAAEQAVVESIADNPLQFTFSIGAPIFIPISMIDSIEISIPSISD